MLRLVAAVSATQVGSSTVAETRRISPPPLSVMAARNLDLTPCLADEQQRALLVDYPPDIVRWLVFSAVERTISVRALFCAVCVGVAHTPFLSFQAVFGAHSQTCVATVHTLAKIDARSAYDACVLIVVRLSPQPTAAFRIS